MGQPAFGGPRLIQGGRSQDLKQTDEFLVCGVPFREVLWLGLTMILALAAFLTISPLDNKGTVLSLVASLRSSSLLSTLAACVIFMVVGPALLMLNKHILDDLHFNHPISLSSLGMVSSSVVSHLAVLLRISEVREETWKDMNGFTWFHKAGLIGLMKALTMSTGNAVYLHLSFGFIQMLKAFTPLIVLVIMGLFGVALPTRAALWCVSAIFSGTLLEVQGELHATVLGLVLMLSSNVSEVISLVLSQKILQSSRLTVLEGMYFIAPAGAACLVVGAIALELPSMLAESHHRIPLEHPGSFACAAALGVAVNFVSLVVLRLTSALTMKILSTARGVGLVAVGIVFYGEQHPWHQLCGYAVALGGFAGYNYFQIMPDAALAVEARVDEVLLRWRSWLWGTARVTETERETIPHEALPPTEVCT